MYVGQSVAVDATVTSAAGDLRHDPVAWTSDQPGVLGASSTGLLTAVRPGRATVTARAGQASATLQVTVAPNPVASVEVAPGHGHRAHRRRGADDLRGAGPRRRGRGRRRARSGW